MRKCHEHHNCWTRLPDYDEDEGITLTGMVKVLISVCYVGILGSAVGFTVFVLLYALITGEPPFA